MNIDKLKNYQLTASIHTLNIKVPGLVANIDDSIKDCLTISARQDNNRQIFSSIIINPNKLGGDLYSFHDFEIAFNKILEGAGIHIDEYELIRSDLRLDSFDQDHYQLFGKLNMLLIGCIANAYSTQNNYRTFDLFSQKQLSTAIKSRYFEVEHYDKIAESHGTDPAASRLELRSKDFKNGHLKNIPDEFITHWGSRLSRAIENFEETQIKFNSELYKLFTEQIRTKKVKSIIDFCAKYQDCIFTKRQLIDLLLATSSISPDQAKTKASNLIKRYKIELFTERNLKKAINEILRATEDFFAY